MKSTLLSLLTAFLGLAVAAPARADRVLLISTDGLRPDAIDQLGEAGAPAFHRIRREGTYTSNARTDVVYTITLPNHTCMIASVGVTGPQGHQWISNTDPLLGQNLHRNRKAYLPSAFGVAHDHGLKTALYASKSKFSLYDTSYDETRGAPDETGPDNGRDKIDRYLMDEDTGKLIDALIESFRTGPADFTMLHLRDCDSTGHKEGWDLTAGSPYMETAKKVDAMIGRLLDAIQDSPLTKDQTWVIITSDHGGLTLTKGHGEAKESDNYTIPFHVWGPRAAAGKELYAVNAATRRDPGDQNPPYDTAGQPIRNGDAGNLALRLLKLPAIPGSTINAAQDLMVTAAP